MTEGMILCAASSALCLSEVAISACGHMSQPFKELSVGMDLCG